MRRAMIMALCLIVASLGGCADAFRVQVPQAVLDKAAVDWQSEVFDQEGGFLEAKTKETRYVFKPEGDGPPFPGVLQVFSIRGGERKTASSLLEATRSIVDEAIEREEIAIDEDKYEQGERTLRSGAKTKWFLQEGTIEKGGGDFFDPQVRITVRILGEAGFDGRSSTGFIVVAFVKVEQSRDPVIPVGGQPIRDEVTWFDVVADPSGSVAGASFTDKDRGLIYNLRTHG